MAMENTTDTTEVPPPDFVVPAVRCALEMVLVGAIILYVGLPAGNPYYLGFVVVAIIAMVTVLFWALNRQMEAWIARARRSGRSGE